MKHGICKIRSIHKLIIIAALSHNILWASQQPAAPQKELVTVPTYITDPSLKSLAQEVADMINNLNQITITDIKHPNFQSTIVNALIKMLPKKTIGFIQKLVITNPQFTPPPRVVQGSQAFAVAGSASYNGIPVRLTALFIQRSLEGLVVSLKFDMPPNWKISDEFNDLSDLNQLTLLSPMLVISSSEYDDMELGLLRIGLNFLAILNLTGPMAKFNDLLQKMDSYVIAKNAAIILRGTIDPGILASTFSFTLPIRIGVDFADLYKKGKIKEPPSMLASIMFGEWGVQFKASDLSTLTHADVLIQFVNQPNPIKLAAILKFVPPSAWSAAIEMQGTWDQAFGLKWLSLGDAALEIGIDPIVTAMMSAAGFPMPINEFGAQGTVAVGEGKNRVQVSAAGKLQINAPKANDPLFMPILILQGSVNKIDITALIQFLGKMIGQPINAQLPPFEFTDLAVKIIPFGGSFFTPSVGTIGSTYYQQGLAAKGGMQIGSFKGNIDFALSTVQKSMSGSGTMTSIKTSYFTFTGTQENQDPSFKLDISPISLDIGATAAVGIPFLGIKRAMEFKFDLSGLSTTTQSVAFFDTDIRTFTLRIPFTNFDGLLIGYEISDTTLMTLKETVKTELASWENSVTKAFVELRADIEKRREVRKKTLNNLYYERNKLKKECDKAGLLEKVVVCTKYAAKETEIQFNEAGKDVLQWTKELSKAAEKVPKGLINAAGDIVDIATAVEITKIIGQITGADLKVGKMPLVTIEVTTNLFGKKEVHVMKDMQFDFKNPRASANSIVNAIIKLFS